MNQEATATICGIGGGAGRGRVRSRRLPAVPRPLLFAAVWLAGIAGGWPLFGTPAVTVKVDPNPVFVGEVAWLQLITHENSRPRLVRFPRLRNLQWLGGPPQVRNSIEIRNFHQSVTYSVSYPFRVTAPGKYTLTGLEVSVRGRRLRLPAPTFTAVTRRIMAGGAAAGGGRKALSLDQVLFVKVEPGAGRTALPERVYVGQEVPLRVDVYVMDRLFANMRYPELQVKNASFHDFSAENPENPHFRRPRRWRTILDGVRFTVISFEFRLAPLARGVLTGQGTVACRLRLPSRQPRRNPFFNDPFFGNDPFFNDPFFNNLFQSQPTIWKTASFLLPKIAVLGLPPVPAGAGKFLGLVGTWDVKLRAAPTRVEVGDPITLTLTVEGTGAVDDLVTPALDIPGFRTHNPEVKKSMENGRNRVRMTWVLVPLEAGATLPPLTFSTFDPVSGKYVPKTFHPKVTVRPGSGAAPAPVVADSGRGKTGAAPGNAAPERRPAASDILYCKTRLGSYVRRPLWRNHAGIDLALALCGFLVWAGCLAWAGRRERLSGDERYRRRRWALRERGAVLRELRSCPPEQRGSVICGKLAPCLAALLDLPPGATPREIAEKIRDRAPELAEMLVRAEESAFRPGGAGDIDPPQLIRHLRKIGLALAAAGMFAGAGVRAATAGGAAGSAPKSRSSAAAGRQPSPGVPGNLSARARFAAATKAYEDGRVKEALALYRSLEHPGTENAGLLYNEGNCAYRLGRLGEAVALYERARRAAPRDRDIIENLNFVRGRLGLPPELQVRNPLELLVRIRDYFRPDEWGLLAALALFLAGVYAGIQRLRRRSGIAAWITAGGVAFVCALAVVGQVQTTYAPGVQAVITSLRAVPRLLPSADSDQAKFALREGECVRIEERRTHWVRIRVPEGDGWVRAEFLRTIW